MVAACAVMAFASCEKDNGGESTDNTGNGSGSGSDTEYAAPTITWDGHDDLNAPVEIESNMDVKINIDVPAGISSFKVDIDSDVLNSEYINLTSLDFVNPTGATSAYVKMILGEQDITTATRLSLDLSEFIPLIVTIGQNTSTLSPDSDHIFTLSIVDKADQSVSQKFTFHYTGTITQEPITMTWGSNPDFGVMDITESMKVDLTITATNGIKSFVVTVDSDNDTFMGIISNMVQTTTGSAGYDLDLIGNVELCTILDGLTDKTLPTGDRLKDQTEVAMDLTSLVSMISIASPTAGQEHSFILNMEDNNGNKFSRTCTFKTVDASSSN